MSNEKICDTKKTSIIRKVYYICQGALSFKVFERFSIQDNTMYESRMN